MLAGLLKGPNFFNPDHRPERAKERLAYVLGCMQEDGVISPEQRAEALAAPPKIVALDRQRREVCDDTGISRSAATCHSRTVLSHEPEASRPSGSTHSEPIRPECPSRRATSAQAFTSRHCRLLRQRRERPCGCRAAKRDNEISPPDDFGALGGYAAHSYLKGCGTNFSRSIPMSPKCPQISDTLIFAGNARLAAQLSCLFAAPGVYVPIMDAPRLQRPDGSSEIVRRGNAAARSGARRFIFAGLTDEERKGLATMIPAKRTVRIDDSEALEKFIAAGAKSGLDTTSWGRDRVGIGLLKALRAKTYIRFGETSHLAKTCL